MMVSPMPVAETAQVSLSAHVPAPIRAESPTRPGCWLVMPPVEVAAERLPRASTATAPTVVVAIRIKHELHSLLGLLELLASKIGDEIGFVLDGQIVLLAKRESRLRHQEYVLGAFHDEPRRGDWIRDPREIRDRAGRAIDSAHNRGVHPDVALGAEHGTTPRIEVRVVLQHADRRLDRLEGRATRI